LPVLDDPANRGSGGAVTSNSSSGTSFTALDRADGSQALHSRLQRYVISSAASDRPALHELICVALAGRNNAAPGVEESITRTVMMAIQIAAVSRAAPGDGRSVE